MTPRKAIGRFEKPRLLYPLRSKSQLQRVFGDKSAVELLNMLLKVYYGK